MIGPGRLARRPGLDLSASAPRLAPRLVGCELQTSGVRARITETEAYHGSDDLACHASKGRTPRSEVLFAEPGTLYCYLCYGIHVLLNLVCYRADFPSAVLIRGVVVEEGEQLVRARRSDPASALERLTNGPGKVSQALGLDLAANGTRLGERDCPLRLVAHPPLRRRQRGPRVGVAYAGAYWAARPWRWWEPGYPAVRP